MNEKSVLESVDHPFVVKLAGTFQGLCALPLGGQPFPSKPRFSSTRSRTRAVETMSLPPMLKQGSPAWARLEDETVNFNLFSGLTPLKYQLGAKEARAACWGDVAGLASSRGTKGRSKVGVATSTLSANYSPGRPVALWGHET